MSSGILVFFMLMAAYFIGYAVGRQRSNVSWRVSYCNLFDRVKVHLHPSEYHEWVPGIHGEGE